MVFEYTLKNSENTNESIDYTIENALIVAESISALRPSHLRNIKFQLAFGQVGSDDADGDAVAHGI
jgi:hypothetical protein